MNTYTYNDVSWRVFGEINGGTVATKFLNAKEAYRGPLTNFLWHAMGIMNYTCKPGPITYTIAEIKEGYSFHMEWETSTVKAQAIHEYSELLKGPGRPVTGKTPWRAAVARHLEKMLAYSSELKAVYTPEEGGSLSNVSLEAMVRFTSLVDAPHIPRLYEDGPQRQVCIFDLFEYEWTERGGLDMEFLTDDEHGMAVRISIPGSSMVLSFGDKSCAHSNLVRFLQAIRNIIHSIPEKVPLVNVATMRTSRYYDEDYAEFACRVVDDDDDNEISPAEVLHTRYVHFRENGTHCSMDIRNIHGWGKRFNLLIREDAELAYEDDWFYRSGGDFLQKPAYRPQPARAQMEAPMRMAFTADEHDLRNAVRFALPALLDAIGPERYKEIYKAEPPFELIAQI